MNDEIKKRRQPEIVICASMRYKSDETREFEEATGGKMKAVIAISVRITDKDKARAVIRALKDAGWIIYKGDASRRAATPRVHRRRGKQKKVEV